MPSPEDVVVEHPVVEVEAQPDHVRLVCHACPDRRRLPLDAVALRVGVPAFLDEHTGCGPVRLSLPEPARELASA